MKKGLKRNSGIVVGHDGSIYFFDSPTFSITRQYDCRPSINIDANLTLKANRHTAFLYEVVPTDLLTAVETEYGKDPFGSGSNFDFRNHVSRILKSGPYTHVFWADGAKTTVRRSPDEPDNDYAAFTAALAIKIYGSNSALKKMLKQKVEVQKLKKKSTECTDTCPIDFEAIERNLAAANSAKDPQEAADYMAKALMGHD